MWEIFLNSEVSWIQESKKFPKNKRFLRKVRISHFKNFFSCKKLPNPMNILQGVKFPQMKGFLWRMIFLLRNDTQANLSHNLKKTFFLSSAYLFGLIVPPRIVGALERTPLPAVVHAAVRTTLTRFLASRTARRALAAARSRLRPVEYVAEVVHAVDLLGHVLVQRAEQFVVAEIGIVLLLLKMRLRGW